MAKNKKVESSSERLLKEQAEISKSLYGPNGEILSKTEQLNNLVKLAIKDGKISELEGQNIYFALRDEIEKINLNTREELLKMLKSEPKWSKLTDLVEKNTKSNNSGAKKKPEKKQEKPKSTNNKVPETPKVTDNSNTELKGLDVSKGNNNVNSQTNNDTTKVNQDSQSKQDKNTTVNQSKLSKQDDNTPIVNQDSQSKQDNDTTVDQDSQSKQDNDTTVDQNTQPNQDKNTTVNQNTQSTQNQPSDLEGLD